MEGGRYWVRRLTGWGSGSHLGYFSEDEGCYLSCMKKEEGGCFQAPGSPALQVQSTSLLAGELALFFTYMLFQP